MTVGLLLVAAGVLACSGLFAFIGRRDGPWGQRLAALGMCAGGALGIAALVRGVAGDSAATDLPWQLPWGRSSLGLDPISAVFLLPVFVVPAIGSIYGLGYWPQAEHAANGRKVCLFYGLLSAGMTLVLLARDGVTFLVAWEVMATSAYFLVTAQDEDEEVRRAGWIYFVATHLGTLCLMAMFALLRRDVGSFALDPQSRPPHAATAIFLLAVAGFGLKAGIMPLHVWLPGAHANAPSHVSAVLSGVMLKLGVYGIVRIAGILPLPPAWWAGLLLALGSLSAVLGIAFAIGQRDLKRVLAYSSIENIGVIVLALGVAVLGRSLGQPALVVLGLGGALLHVLNHALMKPLLFLNAGAIIHAAGTREISRLGGLARQVPVTAVLFVVGAIAICALPPLNGFTSEFLIYLGLFRTFVASTGPGWPAAALAAPALALAGALAVVCFVRLYGSIFLGEPRSDAPLHPHEPGRIMLGSMAPLALGCLLLGVLPWVCAPLLDRAITAWSGTDQTLPPLLTLAPLVRVGVGAAAFLALVTLLAWLIGRSGARPPAAAGTWDCGYARPTARMQYTPSSFGRSAVGLFSWALRPRTHEAVIRGAFPKAARTSSVLPDTVLDRAVLPAFRFLGRIVPRLRVLQQGRIHVYVLYFVAIVLVLLAWGGAGGTA